MAKMKTAAKDLENKFEETAFRMNQERNDFFLPQIIDFVNNEKWINLKPEYQRRLVWDDTKRSLFIESLLLNVPIPTVFLYEWELNRYEVMDGQQRLNAVVDFYENRYELKGLEKWNELNGYQYKDLPETLKRGLNRRRISATVLVVESGLPRQQEKDDVRKLVFERLNTGGQQLNAQELRNCLYAGKFNDLLISLAREAKFCEAWGIPIYKKNIDTSGVISKQLSENATYKRMIDCEIVLRYFAFKSKSRIRGSVKSILDKCMSDFKDFDAETIQSMREEFVSRLNFCLDVFGQKGFQYKDENGAWKRSQPLYDAIMISIDRLWEKRSLIKKNRAKVRAKIDRLLADETAFETIVGRPNTSKAIISRIDMIEGAIKAGAGIK